MHDTTGIIENRILRAHLERIQPAKYRRSAPVAVTAWEAPGEPVSFAEATAHDFTALEPGTLWGRPWGTTWLRIEGTVPADWPAGPTELVVELGFLRGGPGFQSEGLFFSDDGRVLKGLEPRNTWLRLDAAPGEPFAVWVEAASNPDVGSDWSFQPTPMGDLDTAPATPLYRFGGATVAQLDTEAVALESDVATLRGVMENLPADSTRRAGILRALERAVDLLDPEDVSGTAAAVRAELAPALAAHTGSTAHRLVGVGHAHIDSAWLWPVRETQRKVARTFSNVLDLMDVYPDFVFAASSAQQYQWMRDRYPDVWERMKARIAEGRFVPVGGMWVESDTNMPGGEAMARQFVAGKGFFLREFGVETDEVWLPDSFGYSAGLPQIVAASNSHSFLTQKISWNDTNRMPHHTFLWEGIDGTRVFTHFPPSDTYNSDVSADDLARSERQHAEKGVSDLAVLLYGYGDGGGGPTREMIETAHRKADLEGSPRVELGRPDAFFAQAKEALPEPPVWDGELYLELHRGTLSAQARTKAGNRRSEHLLREAELWAATAAVRAGADYPADELRRAWETVLLQQFHDILPGSSIAWVHREAERNYAAVAESLEGLIASALVALGSDEDGAEVAFNAGPLPVQGVPALGAARAIESAEAVVADDEDGFTLDDGAVRARIDGEGHLVSLIDLATGRDAVPPGTRGNDLQLFRDTPNRWDAWDVDRAYQRMPLDRVRTTAVRREGAGVVVERVIDSAGRDGATTTIEQRITLHGGALDVETRIDWHETQKMLKLAFPADVHTATAASEVQFGHVRRPTHVNTSWDAARFETQAHRWVHVDEPGFGVTVANDRVYGHDVTRHARAGGGTWSLIRDTLLRAPLFPDPHADQGEHVFRHSVTIGDLATGVAAGYRLNLPLRRVAGAAVEPLVAVTGDGILVEAVKLAEDGSGDVVVRLYESRGARARGRLEPGFATTGAQRTDLLERPLDDQPTDALALELRPFELVTLRLAR